MDKRLCENSWGKNFEVLNNLVSDLVQTMLQ